MEVPRHHVIQLPCDYCLSGPTVLSQIQQTPPPPATWLLSLCTGVSSAGKALSHLTHPSLPLILCSNVISSVTFLTTLFKIAASLSTDLPALYSQFPSFPPFSLWPFFFFFFFYYLTHSDHLIYFSVLRIPIAQHSPWHMADSPYIFVE